MTKTTSSTTVSAQHKILSSPMRGVVHATLMYVLGGDASLSEIRSSIERRFDEDNLPRNWKVQVRDVLKHDPEIEKEDDGSWVLRTPGFEA